MATKRRQRGGGAEGEDPPRRRGRVVSGSKGKGGGRGRSAGGGDGARAERSKQVGGRRGKAGGTKSGKRAVDGRRSGPSGARKQRRDKLGRFARERGRKLGLLKKSKSESSKRRRKLEPPKRKRKPEPLKRRRKRKPEAPKRRKSEPPKRRRKPELPKRGKGRKRKPELPKRRRRKPGLPKRRGRKWSEPTKRRGRKSEPPKKGKKRSGPTKEISPASLLADVAIQRYLAAVMEAMIWSGADLGLKSFINQDQTVDGEVRASGLPEEWRTEEGRAELEEFLSDAMTEGGVLVPGEEQGGYWLSVGVRFGPQTDAEVGDLAEMYKRFRGLFQVATYPVDASLRAALGNAVVGVGLMIKSLIEKRGLPPSVVFVRVTWTPTGERPSRFEGEKGGGD